MKVEQCIIERVAGAEPRFNITGRVWLECEMLELLPASRVRVALLEAGAGLDVGAELTVHAAKVAETAPE